MADPNRKHEDTSVSLHPRTFREAIKQLVDSQKDTKLAARGGNPRSYAV